MVNNLTDKWMDKMKDKKGKVKNMTPLTYKLYSDYCSYYLQTGYVQMRRNSGKPITSPKLTTTLASKLNTMAGWCSSRSLDPRKYLYTLFQMRRFMFAPKLEHLISENACKKYFEISFPTELQNKINTEISMGQTIAGKVYDPNLDVSPVVEKLKLQYKKYFTPQTCMENIKETLGYHPKSKYCNRCPNAIECGLKLKGLLGVDILRLRSERNTHVIS